MGQLPPATRRGRSGFHQFIAFAERFIVCQFKQSFNVESERDEKVYSMFYKKMCVCVIVCPVERKSRIFSGSSE